jgi:hypothetical protein
MRDAAEQLKNGSFAALKMGMPGAELNEIFGRGPGR